MTDDFLFLTTGKAAQYRSCSRDEPIAWVKPDRRMPGQLRPGTGECRWSKQTLDRANPHIETRRACDRAEARDEAAKARRTFCRSETKLASMAATWARAICAGAAPQKPLNALELAYLPPNFPVSLKTQPFLGGDRRAAVAVLP
jgi:hypothetical protein